MQLFTKLRIRQLGMLKRSIVTDIISSDSTALVILKSGSRQNKNECMSLVQNCFLRWARQAPSPTSSLLFHKHLAGLSHCSPTHKPTHNRPPLCPVKKRDERKRLILTRIYSSAHPVCQHSMEQRDACILKTVLRVGALAPWHCHSALCGNTAPHMLI